MIVTLPVLETHPRRRVQAGLIGLPAKFDHAITVTRSMSQHLAT